MSIKNELFEKMLREGVISLDLKKLFNYEKQELIQMLNVIKDYNFNISYNELLLIALKDDHIEVVKLLLQNKLIDPSAGGNYAIRSASKNGHIEVVKLLLQDNRVDPSADDNYAIRYASRKGHTEVVKLLLQNQR